MAHNFDPTAEIPAAELKAASTLQSHELKWKAASKFLKSNGYYLPDRYQESWSPSWQNGNKHASQCPDFRRLSLPGDIIEAKTEGAQGRVSVLIQYVKDKAACQAIKKVIDAIKHGALQARPDWHCSVPIAFLEDDNAHYIVMPYFARVDEFIWTDVNDLLNAIKQVLEGLAFMHSRYIALRNADADALRFQMPGMKLNEVSGEVHVDNFQQARALVKYYFFDWSNAFITTNPHDTMTRGYPKMSDVIDIPEKLQGPEADYNPYKLDVFLLGTWIKRHLIDQAVGAGVVNAGDIAALDELVHFMKNADAAARPTAKDALARFVKIRNTIETQIAARA